MFPSATPRLDLLIALSLGLMVAFGAYRATALLPAAVTQEAFRDVWFQSAAGSILSQAGDRLHPKHSRNNIHPFFSIATHPPTQLLARALGIDTWQALRLLTAMAAVLTIGGLFLIFRLIRCRLLDAILLTLLAAVSAASVFFLGLPETFPFGAASLVAALLLLAWAEHRPVAAWWYVVINLLTVGFVTTNWMAGLAVTAVTHRLRATIGIIAAMLVLAAGLLAVEKAIYPASRFVLDIEDEMTFVNHPDAGGPRHVATSFVYHTLIAPAIHPVANPNEVPGRPDTIMSTQLSAPGSASAWAPVLPVLWTGLLALGAWALWTVPAFGRMRLVTAALLAGQLALHLVYGEETFLYSLHFIVPLMLLPAFATRTRLRPLALALIVLLIPTVAANNLQQFHRALETFTALQASVAPPDTPVTAVP